MDLDATNDLRCARSGATASWASLSSRQDVMNAACQRQYGSCQQSATSSQSQYRPTTALLRAALARPYLPSPQAATSRHATHAIERRLETRTPCPYPGQP